MEALRKLIREAIEEVLKSPHYSERVVQRFKSSDYTVPEFDFSQIQKQLDFINNSVNFNPEQSFGIFIKSFEPTFYKSKDPVTGDVSQGTDVWILIRNNEVQTAMFRRKPQRVKPIAGIEYITSLKKIKSLFDSGVTDISGSDLQIKSTGSRKKVELDLPVVTLQGKRWYIDEPNEQIIYTKNTKKTVSFDNAFKVYPESEIEKLYDPTTWER